MELLDLVARKGLLVLGELLDLRDLLV